MRPNSETLLPSSGYEGGGGTPGLATRAIPSAPHPSAGPARVQAAPLGGGVAATGTMAHSGIPASQPGIRAPVAMSAAQVEPVKIVPAAGQATMRVVQREA
jgi:hypothetical protein